ncbi:MAG TPA: carboxypeptidase-like regulatory domain-containing protein, partial [Flavisolibacter sp.]|nr:carboxypeptidase-like regulatory domain-containing protein [Flavisolibacter sp.]
MPFQFTSRHALRSLILFSFFFLAQLCFAQNEQVSGSVTDSTGNPLAGASVKIKGTSKATKTNEQGAFLLDNAPKIGTLIISFIGFSTREINFSNGAMGAIQLQESVSKSDEVVVTGVFDKRTALRSSIAISTLNSEAIAKITPKSAAD